ncbi:MAG: alpha/beta hydrolase [Alphaproteobacteria bacterium]|nr:alpha/beta hydrolase [Alphaproteobacteria bacterium]
MPIQKIFILALCFALLAGACTLKTELKQQTANHIARPAFMVERDIQAGAFTLKAWERMHAPMEVATIYIEGDGITPRTHGKLHQHPDWVNNNPTPINPVALHLASRDQSKNLAYLARPCQFLKNPENQGCARTYWEENRFAPEVIASYDQALNDIADLYNVTGFHVVGYDGGANIAAVLAAKRQDILSLRTVAGNLNPDHESSNLIHRPLAGNAVLAIDYASGLAMVPQHHFIGAADEYIQPGVYHSFRQMLGLSECVHYSLVPDADHTRGWVEKWPELLTHVPQCAIVHQDLPPPEPIIGPIPGNYHKGMSGYRKP